MGHIGVTRITIRVDAAPGFVALTKDPELHRRGISLVIGEVKNKNKNPIAEKAIEELGMELLKHTPEGGPISILSLTTATSFLNSRIRHNGLSAKEVWTQRDQVTGDQLPICDRELILNQHAQRIANHGPSSKCKAHGKTGTTPAPIHVGDLIYLSCDRDKTKQRDRYLVVNIDDPWGFVRKFTQSQFRSKTYKVRLSECYPVPPGISHDPQVYGLPSDTSDDDNEDDLQPVPPTDLPTPNIEVVDADMEQYQPTPDSPQPAPSALTAPPPDPATGSQPLPLRPPRTRHNPAWMTSDEWEFQ